MPHGEPAEVTATVHDILENTQHLAGVAVCLACRHEWAAVAPSGAPTLECPECGLDRGVFSAAPLPEIIFECLCGCGTFYIEPGIIARCTHCGSQHYQDDLSK